MSEIYKRSLNVKSPQWLSHYLNKGEAEQKRKEDLENRKNK